jgi:O-antigen ligase
MFGFPHPNGFAIEPQFMGNLLLAPGLFSAWLLIKKQIGKKSSLERSRGVVSTTVKSDSARYFSTESSSVAVSKTTTGLRFLCSDFLPVCFFIIVVTLFLTFSRGAIYAFVVGMMFLTGFEIARVKKKERGRAFRRFGVVWGVVIGAFVVSLGVQGLMAEVSPTTDTFATGVSKVINHLSLGVIDFGGGEKEDLKARSKEVVEKPVEKSEEDLGGAGENELMKTFDADLKGDVGGGSDEDDMKGGSNGEKEEAVFDGYVAESTDTRVRLTGAALTVWRQNPKNLIIGVGIGGAGQALYNNGLSPAPREIVQNEYASLLLEIGVIGVLFVILVIVLCVRAILKNTMAGVIMALMVSYGVSLMFFSGLPNALHIYLMPVGLMAIFGKVVKCDRIS